MGFINFIVSLLRDPRTAIAGWIAAGPLSAYGCVFLIIFIETGVVFFPFLPGDSLLFAAGFFAQGGGFNIFLLLGVAWAAAIVGDQCNFMIGHFFGRRIIASGKVKAMTPERLAKSEAFLDKWGHLAIFLGRFFPFIRTFVPFIAGMGGMKWHNFVTFNILAVSRGPPCSRCSATSSVASPWCRSTSSCFSWPSFSCRSSPPWLVSCAAIREKAAPRSPSSGIGPWVCPAS